MYPVDIICLRVSQIILAVGFGLNPPRPLNLENKCSTESWLHNPVASSNSSYCVTSCLYTSRIACIVKLKPFKQGIFDILFGDRDFEHHSIKSVNKISMSGFLEDNGRFPPVRNRFLIFAISLALCLLRWRDVAFGVNIARLVPALRVHVVDLGNLAVCLLCANKLHHKKVSN